MHHGRIGLAAHLFQDPAAQARFDHLAPREPFEALPAQENIFYATARSPERYDRAVNAFTSIDPAGAAMTYREIKPLIQEAYADLGFPDDDFDGVRVENLIA